MIVAQVLCRNRDILLLVTPCLIIKLKTGKPALEYFDIEQKKWCSFSNNKNGFFFNVINGLSISSHYTGLVLPSS